ncbi:glutamine--fructose-6-phosphate aminotransferase [isomerizing] [Clostridia bacterium]|nr:glutamine--fructose-6-phosphate aminotransferase [isomerizing] [Clostridia bacterium]
MCGISGYVGPRKVCDIIVKQLKKMEYRGYDSVGLSVVNENGIKTIKTVGRVAAVEKMVENANLSGACGIGHTRWATHGEPSVRNAHPHSTSKVSIVHNGIIENSEELKKWLESRGYVLESETDSEVIAKLLDFYYDGNPVGTLRKVSLLLEGAYALGILFYDVADAVFALKKDGPLIVGICDDEKFLSSDLNAILEYTNRYFVLEEDEIAVIKQDKIEIFGADNKEIKKAESVANWQAGVSDKQGFPHFMRKEIAEQPCVISNIILKNIKDGLPNFSADGIPDDYLNRFKRVCIVACGTARYAGLAGKNWIEKFARIPVDVIIASEFRYMDPILSKDTLVIFISQSGETADTLAAARLVKAAGINAIGIINTVGSSITREVDYNIFTEAGIEVAVASTKAYMAQIAVLYLFALKLGLLAGSLTTGKVHFFCNEFIDLPEILEQLFVDKEEKIESFAMLCLKFEIVFFTGRGLDYLLVLEGALKLKEISYINAQAYAAGELKHGPISLITKDALVIALATQGYVLRKTVSNVQEIKARGGNLLLLFKSGMDISEELLSNSIKLPRVGDDVMPFLAAAVLQLLAYHVACAKKLDVDKPRNLAKSVTVE